MANRKPILGLSMGDPAGIGPEIAVKAFARKRIYEICKPIIVGDGGVIKDALRINGMKQKLHLIAEPEEARFEYGWIDVVDLKNVDTEKLQYGKVSGMAGTAAFEAVLKVINLALDKRIDCTVTGPINKEAINKAGYHYSGHTEIYAHFTNTKDYSMMLLYNNLRVVHISTHVSLRQACDLVKQNRIIKVIRLAHDACKKIGIGSPRIGVAGLNPHAGENGLFGWEEEKEIIPAIEKARGDGINAEGPIPPDTVFAKARGGWYDIVVAMYHDQGHIPLKALGFIWNDETKKWDDISGVNITLGLPIIRTSVDHGTAFDLAGKGIASELSLLQAIEYGVKLVEK